MSSVYSVSASYGLDDNLWGELHCDDTTFFQYMWYSSHYEW